MGFVTQMTNGDDDEHQDTDNDDPSESLAELAASVQDDQATDGEEHRPNVDLETADDQAAEESEFSFGIPEQSADSAQIQATEEVKTAANTLLLGPLQGEKIACSRYSLLMAATEDTEDVIVLTLSESPETVLNQWQTCEVSSPTRLRIVTLTENTAMADDTDRTASEAENVVAVEQLSSPDDLTRLGITITQQLSEIDMDTTRVAFDFHSLTEVLQYVETERLFKFLHILLRKLESVNAYGQFQIDPKAHDQETVRIFLSLFDSLIEIDSDGSMSVDVNLE